jgi:hypothetical protein
VLTAAAAAAELVGILKVPQDFLMMAVGFPQVFQHNSQRALTPAVFAAGGELLVDFNI